MRDRSILIVYIAHVVSLYLIVGLHSVEPKQWKLPTILDRHLCSLTNGYFPPEELKGRNEHEHFDALPGQICPLGSVCYEDLHDDHENGIYINSTLDPAAKDCRFVKGYKPKHVCITVAHGLWRKWCEFEILQEREKEAIQNLHKYSKLGRGEKCDYKAEFIIRRYLVNPSHWNNPYIFLTLVEAGRLNGGFCDGTKLLVCREGNTCQCGDYSAPRLSNDLKTESDYCYRTTGNCKGSAYDFAVILTVEEKKIAEEHYAFNESINCEDNNVCILLDKPYTNPKGKIEHQCIDGPWNVKNTSIPVGPGGGGIEPPSRFPDDGVARAENSMQIVILLIPILIWQLF